MTIEIGEGRSGTIEVRDGDDTLELASTFCVMHRLPVNEIVEPLSYSIEKTLHSAIKNSSFPAFASSASPLTEEDLGLPDTRELVSDLQRSFAGAQKDSSEQVAGSRLPDSVDHEYPNGSIELNSSASASEPRSGPNATPANGDTGQTDWYHQLCEKAIRQVERRRRELADTTAVSAAARANARQRCVGPLRSHLAAPLIPLRVAAQTVATASAKASHLHSLVTKRCRRAAGPDSLAFRHLYAPRTASAPRASSAPRPSRGRPGLGGGGGKSVRSADTDRAQRSPVTPGAAPATGPSPARALAAARARSAPKGRPPLSESGSIGAEEEGGDVGPSAGPGAPEGAAAAAAAAAAAEPDDRDDFGRRISEVRGRAHRRRSRACLVLHAPLSSFQGMPLRGPVSASRPSASPPCAPSVALGLLQGGLLCAGRGPVRQLFKFSAHAITA